jgi:hypothetical protein
MSDRALANAERRRDQIAAEINKLNQRVDELRKYLSSVERFIDDWHEFAGEKKDSQKGNQSDLLTNSTYTQARIPVEAGGLDSPPPTPAPPKNPDKADVGKVAKTIIYELRRPVPRTELFKALAERGVILHGKDPEMVLSTMLWRMKEEFIRLPGHGYWIRSLRWPAAKYEPGDSPPADIEDMAIHLNALHNEDDT